MARPVLLGFSSEIVDRIIGSGTERNFSEGSQIFTEGEQADFLPTVLSGRVKMVRYPVPGKEVIIGTFGPGEIFAIPPALDGKKFPATATAMEDSRILIMPRPQFLDLLKTSQEFSAVIMQRMCGILRDRSDTIQVLSTQSAEQRIAKVLLSLFEKERGDFPFKVKLRRQDIAEMAGLTLESTIRSIRKLAERGMMSIVRGKIVLESTDELERLVRS